jgi:hypothetical protein
MAAGIKLNIDTSELLDFVKHLQKAAKVTKPILAVGLNDVGDSLVSLLAVNLTKQTGLSLEEVRGLFKVKRAKVADLTYDVSIDPALLEDTARNLEGGRESTDFGKMDPNRLVVWVSKNDELVCMDCEEMQAAGPMPASVAASRHPRHPNCRCILLPYVQKGKRLPVTMTTVTGTSATKRGGRKTIVDQDRTLRQLAQDILDKTSKAIRIELS